MLHGYQAHCITAFLTFDHPASDGSTPDWRASHVSSEELPMATLSKTSIPAASLAPMATSALSQVPRGFNPGMAYMYGGPGKMTAMGMASGRKNNGAMMMSAKKVPSNT